MAKKKTATKSTTEKRYQPLAPQIAEKVIVPWIHGIINSDHYTSLEDAFSEFRSQSRTDFTDAELHQFLLENDISIRLVAGDEPAAEEPEPDLNFEALERVISEEPREDIEEILPESRPPVRSPGPSSVGGPAPLPGGLDGTMIHDQAEAQKYLH